MESTAKIMEIRQSLLDVIYEVSKRDDEYFRCKITPKKEIFDIAIKDFNNMEVSIPMSGLFNMGREELSAEGEELREQYPDFKIWQERGYLHVKYNLKTNILTQMEILESIMYDLKDDGYENNLEEINQLETEINTLEKVLDKSRLSIKF